ncbi:MAG: peptidoglycan-binding protein [Clostridia bacterium]|nr:peptidoglycan-binding protein [Clostridia bacterium]
MKKMGGLGKLITLVLLAVMAVALFPAADAAAETQYGYLIINNDSVNRVVNFRPKPGTTDYITRLPEGLVMEVLGVTTKNDVRWYQVSRLSDGRVGYIHGDFLHEMNASEVDAWVQAGTDVFPSYASSTPQPTAAPTAAPTTPPSAGSKYIRLVKDKVNIRKTANGSVLTGPMDSKMPVDTVLEYFEGPTEKIGGYNWVLINYQGIVGYVRSDCYVYCDEYGKEVSAPSSPIAPNVPTASPVPGQMGNIRTTAGQVNLRKDTWGTAIGRIAEKGTVLPYYGTKIDEDDFSIWFYVYDAKTNQYGYVLSTFAETTDQTGTATPAPTQAPVTTGYLATSMDYVWIRNAPKAGADTVGKISKAYTVLTQTGAKVEGDPYDWYPVMTADGTRGYIRSDCIEELAAWQVDYYTKYGVCPTPTPAPATPRPGNSSYIITTDDDLWVRTSPSKKASVLNGDTQLDKDYVTEFYATERVSGVTWYKIMIGNQSGWVHGSFVRVMTNAEYDQWLGQQPTPTPKPTATPLPDPSTFSDMAMTTTTKVKLRANPSANSKELTMLYNEGTKLTYLGNYAQDESKQFYWFNVKYGSLSGWMHGDFVRVLTVEEKKMYELAGNPDAPQEATYRKLSLGSTGEDVQALQNKLVEKGYLDAQYVTGTYQTATEDAVKAFQKANKLAVDGIAGDQTQHALFGTVPEGYYTGSTVTPVLYPVEKSDWWTGDINKLWAVGTKAIITDVKTGISFRAQRLYGDNHADAEPATTEDTEAICRIFGVNNPQEISDREQELQSYRRRPLWVTIGNRTFCGSMYGIPHNYDGDRIPDNNYNGQFCVHFTNSMTHGSKDNPAKVDVDNAKNGWYGHQSAIEDAYKQSQSGWKDK